MIDTVRKIVAKYKTRDPFEIADAMGVVTITEDLSGSTNGFYFYHNRSGVICIDSKLSEEKSRVVCAHELGHYVLHREDNSVFLKGFTYYTTNKLEIQANRFAAHLLIPDEVLLDYRDSGFCVSQIAAGLEVPKSILELKLADCRI
ncbi:ImmA/IrrE family metallo-endopeptidase [Eubacterium barkeri]|uniref:IrrE N-terminal-like domain-containing protein n=1 Tax=Eubacterium barkeri TaxID=1528 RepID=A0A1H3HFL7_EUBBA|nr:ImmA/IrrE family metallo-endopeptidase [Eubacterium barkeri]SDY14252.1 protein of unknown function [Eubacterium barkeri]